jgi:molecular chaperone DnaJ
MIEADYYELLGVQKGADDRTIKTAYRSLAMKFHPDRNPGCGESEAKFKAINEAYDCLKDPQKRAAYDRYGKAAFQNGGAGGAGPGDFGAFSDIFDNIFGEFTGRGRGQQQRSAAMRGADLRYDLELSFEEAFTGKTADLEIEVSAGCDKCGGTGAEPGAQVQTCGTCHGAGQVRMQQGFFVVERTCPGCRGVGQIIADPCEPCLGTGRVERRKNLQVKVPAGVDEGTRIRVSGEGEAGFRNGPAGDLYIFVHLRSHELFKRDGTTLYAQAPISITTAALGGEIEVPCLDRKGCTIKIPAGTQSGKQFRVRGKGMPALNHGGFGDLVVQIEVETPVRLSARQRELLEEFQHLEGSENNCPKSRGFFTKLKNAWDELTE